MARKLFLSVIVILLIPTVYGCQHLSYITAPENRPILKADIDAAVSGYIAFNDNQQKEKADRVIEVATRIKEAANTDVTTSDFRRLVTRLVLDHYVNDDNRRYRVQFIIDLIFSRIQARVPFSLNVIPETEFPKTRQLITDCADQAIETALRYKNL